MNLERNGMGIKKVIERNTYKLSSSDDAMQIIYGGANSFILQLQDLPDDFFDLKNKLAGDVFQKFVNYRFPVAFVIPEKHGLGDRVTELMIDHKNHPFVRFYGTKSLAEEWLATL